MAKKKLLLLFNLLLCISFTYGQTEPDTSWKSGGFVSLTFTQVNFSQWAKGGENSLSLASSVNLFSNYIKGKTEFLNNLDLGFAMVKTGTEDMSTSDDKIELNSKYSRKFAEHWLYSFLFNFKSQFAPGYATPNDSVIISNFFSPAYFTLGVGVTYKPVEFFEVLLSPATAKITVVNDKKLSDAGAYGVDPGKTVRTEFGAYLNAKFNKEIMENVTLTSVLELFDNYTDKDKDNQDKVDVNWDTTIILKVNKYITARLNTVVIYDANVVETTQFKEILGLGFGYKF